MANDRWSNEREISRVLHNADKACGPVLQYKHGVNRVYNGDGHTLFLGVTGSGKTWNGTLPLARTCIERDENLIVLDSKGDIYKQTSYLAERKGYRVIVFNFRDLLSSDHINPIQIIRDLLVSDDIKKVNLGCNMMKDLVYGLYPLNGSEQDFWQTCARNIFMGSLYALSECAPRTEANFESIHQLIIEGQERYRAGSYIKEFVRMLPESSNARKKLMDYITTANDTAAGMRSSFSTGMSFYMDSPLLLDVISSNDGITLDELDGENKTAIYIVLPDETSIFDNISAVIINMLITHFITIAHDKYGDQGEKLPRRMNIILEELGNIAYAINDLDHSMSACRSRNIRLHLVLQSLTQLDNAFGTSKAKTIIENAGVTMAFRVNNMDSLNELSRRCGERDISRNGYTSREPLVKSTELMSLKRGQALVIIEGGTKFITELPGYDKMFDNSKWEAPKKKQHSKRAKIEYFNIKSYIENPKSYPADEKSNTADFNPLLNSVNFSGKIIPISEYVEKLDKRIAELEKEEQQERLSQKNKLILKRLGDDRMKTIALIKKYEHCSIKEAFEYAEKLPFVIAFKTIEDEMQARKDFEEAGADIE